MIRHLDFEPRRLCLIAELAHAAVVRLGLMPHTVVKEATDSI